MVSTPRPIRPPKRHCSRDSEIRIDKVRDGVYTPRPNLLPQETMLCADLVNMYPTPPRVSSTSTISLSQSWWPTITITTTVPALDVGIWPLATKPAQRTLHDLGDLKTGCPVDLLVTYSSHYCSICRKHFNIDLSELALPGSHYTCRVIQLAVRLVVGDGVPYRPAGWHLWRDHRVFVPFRTLSRTG